MNKPPDRRRTRKVYGVVLSQCASGITAVVTVIVIVSHRVTVTPIVDVPSHATRQRESRAADPKLPEIIGFFCFLVIPHASPFHVIFAVLFSLVL